MGIVLCLPFAFVCIWTAVYFLLVEGMLKFFKKVVAVVVQVRCFWHGIVFKWLEGVELFKVSHSVLGRWFFKLFTKRI